jgi:hypothetical protein
MLTTLIPGTGRPCAFGAHRVRITVVKVGWKARFLASSGGIVLALALELWALWSGSLMLTTLMPARTRFLRLRS